MIRLDGDCHHRPRDWARLSQETPEEGAIEGEDDPLGLDMDAVTGDNLEVRLLAGPLLDGVDQHPGELRAVGVL